MGLERCENAVVRGSILGQQTSVELLAWGGQRGVPTTPVPTNHAPLDQPSVLKLPDDHAYVVPVDTKTRRKPDLIETRLAIVPVEVGQHAILQRRNVRRCQ